MICEKDNLGLKDIVGYLSNAFSKYSDFVILPKFCGSLIPHFRSIFLVQTFALCIFAIIRYFYPMSIQIQYQKAQVIQGLRYHFIKQSEIKGLMLIVNLYAIVTAVLLLYKKIRPELFLLGSLLWIVLMVFFWYLLPWLFYRRTLLFKQDWVFNFNHTGASIESDNGRAEWAWSEVTRFFESPLFFHVYFAPKSFFILPKTHFSFEEQQLIRSYFKKN